MKVTYIEEMIEQEVPVLDLEGNQVILDEVPQTEAILVGTGEGTVTGINRGPIEGEKVVEKSPQFFIYGYFPEYYKFTGGSVLPLPLEEKEIYKNKKEKEEAFKVMIDKVDQFNRDCNLSNFSYAKEGENSYPYYSDSESIQAVAIEITLLPDEDPIPVPNGVWKTAEKEEDGITPIYISYTCGEFKAFKTAYYQRSSDNFGVKEYHKNNIKTLYKDLTISAEDILSYDYTIGWN